MKIICFVVAGDLASEFAIPASADHGDIVVLPEKMAQGNEVSVHAGSYVGSQPFPYIRSQDPDPACGDVGFQDHGDDGRYEVVQDPRGE